MGHEYTCVLASRPMELNPSKTAKYFAQPYGTTRVKYIYVEASHYYGGQSEPNITIWKRIPNFNINVLAVFDILSHSSMEIEIAPRQL